MYSPDVVSFARERGYFNGVNKDFSFSLAYAPLDFGARRFCEARVWSYFCLLYTSRDTEIIFLSKSISKQNIIPVCVDVF